MGEPSPSLAKINQMTTVMLKEKIESLKVEMERLQAKLQRLSAQPTPPTAKIKTVSDLLERLEALRGLAEKRLEERVGPRPPSRDPS